MKRVANLGAFLALAACLGITASAAEEAKELAVLKGTGVRVNSLAFSADGSRLAAAMSGSKKDKNGKSVPVPGQAILWNVDSQQKVSVCEQAKADFTHLWLSADGKTLVTVDQGIMRDQGLGQGIRHDRLALMVGGNRGYQAWDAETGKTIGPIVVPHGQGQFTAAAVSPDGHYLAAVWNEQAISPKPPLKPYLTGEIRVWDVREAKPKWTLAGSTHSGPVAWFDALAFSPDGTRLAAYRATGDPSSDFTAAAPDLRGSASKPLKVLTLEEGKDAPTVATLEKGGIALPGRLEWPAGGKTLIVRDGRSFELFDSATGKSKETFKLPMLELQPAASGGEPASPAGGPAPQPKRLPNGITLPTRPPPTRFALPNSTGPGSDAPQNYFEPQSSLSSDGSRLAVYFIYGRENKRVIESRIGIWDVAGRRLLGTIRLPDEDYPPVNIGDTAVWKREVAERPRGLALSGDGKRLAVSDENGTVRVFDTTSITEISNVPVASSAKATPAEIAKVRSEFERAVQQARKELLGMFDSAIGQRERTSAKAQAAILKKEKGRFERDGLIPWSTAMNKGRTDYLLDVAAAQAKVHSAVSAADMPAELRELVDNRVVARWKQTPGDRLLTFYANGKLNDPMSDDSWSYNGGRLILRWSDKDAPGGYWVDTCRLDPDGRSYSGTNQKGGQVSGTYVDERR